MSGSLPTCRFGFAGVRSPALNTASSNVPGVVSTNTGSPRLCLMIWPLLSLKNTFVGSLAATAWLFVYVKTVSRSSARARLNSPPVASTTG